MQWSPEQFEKAKSLFAAGHSAREIAKALKIPGLTRSAVLGILHRNGVYAGMPQRGHRSGREAQNVIVKPQAEPKRAAAPKKKHNGSPFRWGNGEIETTTKPPREFAPEPVIVGKTIVDVGFGECRYQTGVDEDDTAIFCAAPTGGPDPWCPCHRKIVFPPGAERREWREERRRAMEMRGGRFTKYEGIAP